MRAKRSKQYKKLVQQYQLHHGFREPYQVLVDGDLVRDAERFTMDLQAGLERTLHGKVKIMITQCCIRHLYSMPKEPGINRAIDLAKTFERRRCGHRPDDFEEALSALECLTHVVDKDGRGENKHRYVVATQDQSVRRYMRTVSGVPLIYINRSVMIMEPMSEVTAQVGASAERAKFRSELRKSAGAKRKRDDAGDEEDNKDDDSDDGDDDKDANGDKLQKAAQAPGEEKKKKKKAFGVKGPNPLSVKKKKEKKTAAPGAGAGAAAAKPKTTDDGAPKKKRIRKHKAQPAGEGSAPAAAAQAASDE
ncbi:U3 small nucleolar RNA-associated protein 23 [Sporothrix schenckii 1099-18]|uniref:U three protein 23 n=2 Tax=Sporothrix schenckii TaxID=29908 RepID=U7PKG3_SPOS1|nr:U3 small nucleolar RNA-associated protein 23 [Sporothrix schenckii 1099-18]ERS96052.1 hypothetical protein HMPREF1624_07588 [Sporothrix schenckii ATCC 58251]KJR81679.1 U3 small nucleolar RNA-associated protein 23 [Sporothrix schenckii 1099-18]